MLLVVSPLHCQVEPAVGGVEGHRPILGPLCFTEASVGLGLRARKHTQTHKHAGPFEMLCMLNHAACLIGDRDAS